MEVETREIGRVGNPTGVFYRKELKHALDGLCDSLDHVGAGTGHFVHDGRVRPHPIGHCPDRSRGQSDSGAKSLVAMPAL